MTDTTGINPVDFAVPGHFRHWHGDQAEDHIGPFFFHVEGDGAPRTAFRVEARHCNSHDTLHGGVAMAFADYTLCLGANGGTQQSVVTVSCNNAFTAPGQLGDLVEGHCEVIKRGRSLVFVRCDLRVGDRLILSSNGVVKLIGPSPG